MKKKQKIIHVQQDQTFLEGINLVTGLKINYDRPVLSQNQINSLCINQKFTRKQKAIKILKNGQALQRWSLFQNLNDYIKTAEDYEQIIHLIQKYFQDFENIMAIVAEGLINCLQELIQIFQNSHEQDQRKQNNSVIILSQKTSSAFFRIIIRAITQQKYHKNSLQDWSVLFDCFFEYLGLIKSNKIKQMIQQCIQYINGSFSMNAMPQRRRIAFQMMKGLISHSQKIKQRIKNKTSFFNNDMNSKTRVVICQTIGKLLLMQPNDQETRKYVMDYFLDRDPLVRQKAFYVLIQVQHEKHLQSILQSVQQRQNSQLQIFLLDNLQVFSLKYQQLINKNKKYQTIMMNFVNSILKSQNQVEKVIKIIPMLLKLYYRLFNPSIQSSKQPQSFNDIFVMQSLNLDNQQIFKSLLILFTQNKDQYNDRKTQSSIMKLLQFYIQKNLTRSTKLKQYFFSKIENLRLYLSIFDYQTQEENSIYLSFLIKAVQQAKWPQVQLLLQKIKDVKILQVNFESISSLLSKLILNTPYYLVQLVSKAILYLILSKRKHLDFFISIKDKLIVSKNWVHRKNYIALYSQVKTGSSYQFQKIIPMFNYKLIVKEKCSGVKLEFLKQAVRIYQSLDPSMYGQKKSIKQAILQMTNDKDEDVVDMAKQILQNTNISDRNLQLREQNNQKNSYFLQEQQKMRQKQALVLKKNKTQKDIGRKDSKSKTITIQSRSSLRIPKDITRELLKEQRDTKQMKQSKDSSKDIKIINPDKLLVKRPSTVYSQKRSVQKIEEDKKPPKMVRYSSGHMKNGAKISNLRKDSTQSQLPLKK